MARCVTSSSLDAASLALSMLATFSFVFGSSYSTEVTSCLLRDGLNRNGAVTENYINIYDIKYKTTHGIKTAYIILLYSQHIKKLPS